MKIAPYLPKFEKLEDKKIVSVLQMLSQIIGLSVPNLFNYNGLAVCYLIYSLLISIALIVLCSWSIYFKYKYIYGNIIITGAVLDAVTIIGATICNVVAILCAVVFRRRNIVKIVTNLKEIESSLNEKFHSVVQFDEKQFAFQFIFLEILIFVYVIFESSTHIVHLGFIHFSFSAIMHINILMVSINVMQIHFFSACIRQYLKIINDELARCMQYSIKFQTELKSKPVTMKFFLKMYDRFCDLIDLVSQSYGVQIILVSLIIIFCLIESMNLLMKFALGIETMGPHWSVFLLVTDTWNSLIYIVFGVILAVSCEQTSTEANNTSTICYKLLLNFPSCPKTQTEEITKNELLLLAEHLSQRKVKFSASGFFAVDHTMLYMIFGSIAAYLVIVLQFK